MAADVSEQIASTSTDDNERGRLSRQLTGTSFLTLEHVGYFGLVVLLPVVLFSAASAGLGLWTEGNGGGIVALTQSLGANIASSSFDSRPLLSLVAVLLVLAPMLYVLRRRVSAEYAKRAGYTSRVAYKLPVYTALAVLIVLSAGSFIEMLRVVLQSFVAMGVNDDVGRLYLDEFLPALLALAIFGVAAWYVLWFAKGRDMSRNYILGVSLLAAVSVVTLFVASLTMSHEGNEVPIDQTYPTLYQDNRRY